MLFAFYDTPTVTESTPAPPLLITDLKGLTFNAKDGYQRAWPRAVFSKAHLYTNTYIVHGAAGEMNVSERLKVLWLA